MSYDLCCWPTANATGMCPQEVYERLCDDEEVDGIGFLDVSGVKAEFARAFPGIEDFGTELNMDGEPWFQIAWPMCAQPGKTQGLLLTCSWDITESPATLARIIDVARALGCAVYDPQSGQMTK